MLPLEHVRGERIRFMQFPHLVRTLKKMKAVPSRDWSAVARSVFLALLTTAVFATGSRVLYFGLPDTVTAFIPDSSQRASAAATVTSPFEYDFAIDGVLVEAGSPDESTSPYWWLDAGGRFFIEDGLGKTIMGSLDVLDEWRIRYRLSNSLDTENGYAPQNLFRLLTRSSWDNVRVSADFRIIRDNLADSPNRNESNGLLLMSRYQDGDTLYYAGVRVDGHAVIKKKFNGTYYTMAEKNIFATASTTYDRNTQANLLPQNEWIGLRNETVTARNGSVTVKLFMKKEGETRWTELLRATDNGEKYASTTPITGSHPIGLRTDFMDVEFDNFRAEEI